MKKIVVYITVLVVIILGVFVFVDLTKNKNLSNNELGEKPAGDRDDYVFSFDEITIANKKIVAFDNTVSDYIKYYVIEFSGDKYISYSYYFLKSHDQYIKKYGELSSTIVDYNYEQFMIKSLDVISEGTYNEFIDNIQPLIDDYSIYLVY